MSQANSPAQGWRHELGFRFNPFAHLEASSDPHLAEYIVGHEVFAAAWDSAPALIFAPAGGGKTAMRISATRTCWSGFGLSHPFPIVHQPHLGDLDHARLDPRLHWLRLVEAGAASLLYALAIFPDRLLLLDAVDRAAVLAFLQRTPPRPLAFYAAVLRSKGAPAALTPYLGRLYGAESAPNAEKLQALCCAWEESAAPATHRGADAQRDFDEMAALLLHVLRFRSLFVLVDGVDALPETADNAEAALGWLEPLLQELPAWQEQQIYVKGFLPRGLESSVRHTLARHGAAAAVVSLHWGLEGLAEVVRRRVFVASGGSFGSLDALSGPGLRDVETAVSRIVKPLPREMIVFVNRLLQTAADASAEATREAATAQPFLLQPHHLAQTKTWYLSQPIRIEDTYDHVELP